MIILGIDPGIALVGYGLVEFIGNKFRLLEYGVIQTHVSQSTDDRLKIIYDQMLEIIDEYEPDEVVYEKLFHQKNTKTFINVSQARGVEILAAKVRGLDVYEYTPLQIKTALTGYGRADKRQMQEAVKRLLSLKEIPRPDDAADALAIAICHCFSIKFKDMFKMK